jgi:mannose-1-phosphate guanylyltransferase
MEHIYAIIMAGGGGTRLWPISRRMHPKHLLPLLGNRTLFQSTLDRLKNFIPDERVYVVTTAEQEKELRTQAPQLPAENFLIEPLPRGTASVVALAATVLEHRDPQATMMVFPADHFIRNLDLFYKLLRVAIIIASTDYLVTLGITATYPATGYGYIQQSTVLPGKFDLPAYRVIHFIEKPNEAQARDMLAGRDHTWNSGIFIWRVGNILEEFSRQMPDLRKAIGKIGDYWGTSKQEAVLNSIWPHLNPETIDFGIMEHALNVAVLPADGLEWSDIGSWDSIFDLLPSDKDGNVVVNVQHLPIETHNSLVYSSGKKLIVTIGLDDLIIVDSGDALLICRRDRSQQVRLVIERIKTSDENHFL